LTGLHVPTLAELNEIETSNRLQRRGEALYLSSPSVMRDERGPVVTPVGYVLTRDRLLTVRFAPLPAFEGFSRDCAGTGECAAAPTCSSACWRRWWTASPTCWSARPTSWTPPRAASSAPRPAG